MGIKPPEVDYENWDGTKIEEDKAMYRSLDNPGSRWHWTVGICLKECLNRGTRCDICFKFSELKEKPSQK